MQSKICVLQVIPNLDVSGASQGCVDVANFLSEKNYNSYILTHSGPKTSEVKDYNEKVFYASVNSKNPIKIFFNIIKIIKLIKKLNITIVHAELDSGLRFGFCSLQDRFTCMQQMDFAGKYFFQVWPNCNHHLGMESCMSQDGFTSFLTHCGVFEPHFFR